MGGLELVLDTVLVAGAPRTFSSLAAFREATQADRAAWPSPVDQALVGGAAADRLGYAFAAGYAAALRRLVPALGDAFASLCVTERGGAHPRAIETTLAPDGGGFRLTGTKRWATLAGEGDVLLVAASAGRSGDRNDVRVVTVPANAEGVRFVAMPPTPFTPEIPHYEVRLEEVRVEPDAVLPGDGYARYVKPFRTVEDIHVSAAAAAYLLRAARAGSWELAPRLAALVVTLRALAGADPSSAAVHVALAGALDALHEVAARAEWPPTSEEGARWQRDLPLLEIAGAARAARLAAASTRLGAAR